MGNMYHDRERGRNDRADAIRRRRELVMRDDEEMAERRKAVQAKLEISQPGDVHEQQADAVAQKVSDGKDASGVLRQQHSSTPATQMKSEEGTLHGTEKLQRSLDSSKGSGQSLPENVQKDIGGKMGADLSDVKIHTGSNAHEMSEGINAKAFTHGQDIYFKQGNYNPATPEGKNLLAHELTHTVQQGNGIERKIQRQTTGDSTGLTELKEELESINVDEKKVLTLLKGLDPGQKTFVLFEGNGYLQLMANALSADTEMKDAMKTLGANLTKTLKWLLKADEASMFDDLSDSTVMDLINAAPVNELAELGKHTDVLNSLKDETGDIIYSAITNKIKDATEEVKPPQEDLTKVAKTHRTVAGDTYGKLAKTYNVSVENLRAWNIYPDTKIPIGVDLYVSDPSKEMALELEAWQRSFGEYEYWQLRKQKGKNFQMTDDELTKYLGMYPEYLPTLKSIIATQSWIDQRDSKVGAIYESMLGDNIGKLTPDQVVAIQDARIQSVKDIQVDYWIALLPIAFAWLPLCYGEPMTPLKSNAFKLTSTVASTVKIGFGTGDKEIITYQAAKAITKGYSGAIQGHHLIEQRFLKFFQMDLEAAPAVILSRTEHQAMTNVLRNLIPFGAKNISKAEILFNYRIAYKQFPTWMQAIENYWK